MVSKGNITFAHPDDIRLAIDEGLRLGQIPASMQNRPGEILGLFAYGHPFFDGNGRTMLLVHTELCRRAGMYIDWQRMQKRDYLTALSNELLKPKPDSLDEYFSSFMRKI